MEVISNETKQCEECSYYTGSVNEKYNGNVPVFCWCQLWIKGIKPNPVMIGYPDGRLFWKPISDHMEADGKYWHTPHFAMGSSLISPKKLHSNYVNEQDNKSMPLGTLPPTWEEFVIQAIRERDEIDLKEGKININRQGVSGEFLFKVFPWERFMSKD